MATTLKTSASIKELDAALASKQATKAQVTAVLKNRIAKNSSAGAVKRAKLALTALTNGESMVKAAFPPAAKKPRPRKTAQATSGGYTQSDLDEAIAAAVAATVASLESRFPGLEVHDESPVETDEVDDDEDVESRPEGWYQCITSSNETFDAYMTADGDWVTEEGTPCDKDFSEVQTYVELEEVSAD